MLVTGLVMLASVAHGYLTLPGEMLNIAGDAPIGNEVDEVRAFRHVHVLNT